MSDFAALDFETANQRRDSACAIGIALVSDGRIVESDCLLIRPPTPDFWFTWLHGIGWNDVRHAPPFREIWPEVEARVAGAEFLAAHNASFDRGVESTCCQAHGANPIDRPWICTVELARHMWDVRPTRLPDICRYLAIQLDHHRAESDARACAQIVIAAQEDGWVFPSSSGETDYAD
ncbi:MAG: 3'-5' exonuclease [Rhodospirillales bacterium]|nr:3'-5' exonuclease [Rhodospirillales bacterium]